MLLLCWYCTRFEPLDLLLDACSIIGQLCTRNNPAIAVKESRISCLEDLPNEILRMTFGYLRSVDVLRAFYSKDMSDRFYRLIHKYRTDMYLWNLSYSDFRFLVDHIFSQSEITNLHLCNLYIPCLIEHFSSLCQETPLNELVTLHLEKCTFMSPSLLTWISKQPKLETFYCNHFEYTNSPLIVKQHCLLRDFIFNNEFPASLHTLYVTLWPGFILYNQLLSNTIDRLQYVQLDLDTFDDLCILLKKNVIPNVRHLLIHLDQPRRLLNQQLLEFPLYHHLVKFTLIEQPSGLRLDEVASVLHAMPALKKLYLSIQHSFELSFARRALIEAILPASLVELHYTANFIVTLPVHICDEIKNDEFGRFPMRICNQSVYTIPWKWRFLDISIPACDHAPEIQHTTAKVWIYQDEVPSEQRTAQLKHWQNTLSIDSHVQLPSLDTFPRLRELITADSAVLHTTMPPTLFLLKLTDETPLAPNAPASAVVHAQVQRLTMARPIRDQPDLIHLLHQFPNLRYLSITLPAVDAQICLVHIFANRTACLPHLICLQAFDGASNLWEEAPFEWLISNTDLKYSSTRFHAAYNVDDGLVVWL